MNDSRPEEDILLKKENLEFGLEFLERFYSHHLPPNLTSDSKNEHINSIEALKDSLIKNLKN